MGSNTLKSTNDEFISRVRSNAVALIITCGVGVLSALLATVRSSNLQYITFTFQLTFRATLYGMNAAVMLMLYPPALFGKLYGLTMLFTFIGAEIAPMLAGMIGSDITIETLYRSYAFAVGMATAYPLYLYFYIKSDKKKTIVQGEGVN